MKIQQIISKQELLEKQDGENECSLCFVHERASEAIPDNLLCPHCKEVIEDVFIMEHDYRVVAQDNSLHEDEEFNKYPIYTCEKCKEYYALIPEKIFYNGNHDIYYTGGKSILHPSEEIPILKELILSSIEAYSNRIKEGDDNLKPESLYMWIEGSVKVSIAKYLFEKGLKK